LLFLYYYALADAGFERANTPKPTAENLELRGMMRYHLGTAAADLGIEGSEDYAGKVYEEAVAFYSEAIKLNPKLADAFENRAMIYRKLGKNELADADDKQFNLLKKGK